VESQKYVKDAEDGRGDLLKQIGESIGPLGKTEDDVEHKLKEHQDPNYPIVD